MNNINHLNNWLTHLNTAFANKSLSKEKVEAELSEIESSVDSLKGQIAPQDFRAVNQRIQTLRQHNNPMRLRQYTYEGEEGFQRNV